MNTFIEKNKKLLNFYYIALRLSGWILLTLGLCSHAITIVMARTLGFENFTVAAINVPLGALHLILFGLLGLAIAQLIRYLSVHNSKPGFILRHGDKFLYAYVVIALIVVVIRNVRTIQYLLTYDINNAQILYFSTTVTSMVLFASKVLILIGVAQFLKRLIPIIEEHKSLV